MLLELEVAATVIGTVAREAIRHLLKSGLFQESLFHFDSDPFADQLVRVQATDVARHGFELVYPALG